MQGFDPGFLKREGLPFYFPETVVESILRSCRKHHVDIRRIGIAEAGSFLGDVEEPLLAAAGERLRMHPHLERDMGFRLGRYACHTRTTPS